MRHIREIDVRDGLERAGEIVGPAVRGPGIPRRDFLKALASLGAAGAVGSVLAPAAASAASGAALFPEGVIAGDPRPDGAVVWTRVAAPPKGLPVPVVWIVAEDPELARVVAGGVGLARRRDAHSFKVRVRGLLPDRWYWYAFFAPGGSSQSGRLRTAPSPRSQPDRLRYAFASCQQRNSSLYVAHRAIARENVDFLMHLGDYIYVSDSGDLALDDYRRRWAIFRSHPWLQELHAAVPLVAMWDDGEFYNGVDRTGDPARLAAARSAWFENMPVLRRPDDRVYRSFPWGRLADVFLIDVRSYRDPEVPANLLDVVAGLDAQDSRFPPGPDMFAAGRTTLGAEQKAWLFQGLEGSGAAWRTIGNPYNMNPWRFLDLDTPQGRASDPAFQRNAGVYVSNEAWDDYQAERREVLEFLGARGIGNVVFTSGHTHFFIASELQPDFDDAASPTAAFDFVTGSLTADPDPRSLAPEATLRAGETLFRIHNAPYMKLVDLLEQGYALVEVTPEETRVEFRGIDTFDPAAQPYTFARFRVASGSRVLEVLPAAP